MHHGRELPFHADGNGHARSHYGFRNQPRFDNQPNTHSAFSPSYATTSLSRYSTPATFPNPSTEVATNTSPKENGYVTELNDDLLDEEMTTPVPNSGPSRHASIDPQANEERHSCACSNTLPSMVSAATPTPAFSVHMGRAVLPNHPLPGFRGLFNPHSFVQVHPNQDRSHIAYQVNSYNQSAREAPLTPEISVVGAPSVSALSAISSNTIEGTLSIAQRRSSLLAALYNICLDASASYTRSLLRPVRRSHAPAPSMRRVQGVQYHPYARDRTPCLQSRSAQAHGSGERTLMDYISMISTHMWRKARGDLLAPRQAESVAVKDMNDLYAWGEFLALAVEDQRPRFDGDDLESEVGAWLDERRDMKIVGVAETLCRWLGDQDALSACRGVSLELKELVKEQAGPRRVSADESLDGFGSIL